MAVAQNADLYAIARTNIFFPGQPSYLTGQCVSLIKWYLGEMCGVSNWQDARGNAKDFGDNLVRQGLATQVTSPRRGDIVVWKQDGGSYGHIAVVCSGGNVFEENVGIAGTRKAVFGGNLVYASGIHPMQASWRKGAPTFYRPKGYSEATKPAPAPAPSTTPKTKSGIATVLTPNLNVRSAPSTSAPIVATYSKGQSFKYDSWCVANGYVWVSYVGASGLRRYLAAGPNDGNKNNTYISGF